ncbi:hypothetical protein [Leptolyngbya sp. NIES-2104]|uniref:hypothetical protein n=1 Tax=Leptolyngbya sp. NIES-2104 TaxID=1552121 RepID=UPI0006ECB974|nr:hypothetical protein [Leptolyngbya sp. NIES-2104]GAP96575.1 hypothetical protein NIES2104_31180 [Leptolyngbya sp. NIES-2104]
MDEESVLKTPAVETRCRDADDLGSLQLCTKSLNLLSCRNLRLLIEIAANHMNLDRMLQLGSSVKKLRHLVVEQHPNAFGSRLTSLCELAGLL